MTAEAPPEPNGRKYRSKKQRPCDLCRSRKIQCKLQGNGVACEMCRKLGRGCTFVLGPLTRKYRACASSDNGSRTETGSLLPYDQQEDPAMGEMSLSNNSDLHMAVDVDPFWLPPELRLGGQTSSNILNMDWSSMEFAHSTIPNESSRSLPSPRADNDGVLPPNAISPNHNNLRPGSGGAAYTVVSSGSPSTVPEADMQTSPQAMDMNAGYGLGGSPRRSITEANNVEARQYALQGWPSEFSLESRKGYSNMLIGLSCESDPYLLRNYYYNEHDIYPMFRLDFRKVVDDAIIPQSDDDASTCPPGQPRRPHGSIPVHFVMADEEIWKDDVKAAEGLFSGNTTEKSDIELLGKLVPPDLGSRLLRLYAQFVHPRFPVLSLRDLERIPESDCSLSVPIGLRSAVYALAAPFTFLDDELSVSKGYLQVSTEDLWAIAHRSFQRASRLSHLSSLQLCLLLLQMPPQSYVAADPPSFWALSCSALALAESLGVNLDPSADDFEGDAFEDPEIRESILQEIPICLAQSALSLIAADVLKEFYTLRANREPLTLSALLSRAQPLRTRIESWRQTLPLLSKPASDLDEHEFEHGAALRLSHLTLEILIFRALLRPLIFQAVTPPESSREPISTIFENSYTCAKVATEIVSSLQAKHFASFWPPYVRYQLCYVSVFLLMNLAQSPTREIAARTLSLLNKWRNTLRIQARAWPLARLAAMRLDAVFWKGLSTAVHGAGPDSPAITLLREQNLKGSGER
ncbi:Fungal specific transcription factor domain protein [Pleurostoma richardsiae]|uniref:Fungal specific transcription factor domain protein n=1 Tax=Pleurostoma richardsiae TaxID=41990 RepID=A0AA38RF98_9PEZI|nr:Fungal specific transcription factor domain protein [Pleurostoma richardsiae]